MPKIPLPVFFSQSHDETSLPDQVGARLVNGFVDKIGDQTVIRKAPGLETINDIYQEQDLAAQSFVQGAFWWDAMGIEITVVNGRFYKKSTATGPTVDITGDALTNTDNPVIFVTNGWMMMAASGGQIVTYHLYPTPITAPGLATGTTEANVANSAFTYYINGVSYSKAAVDAGTAPGNDVIPAGKYGAAALDIDSAGTITVAEAAANATGYDTAALAVAGIPTCDEDKCRMGWVSAACVNYITAASPAGLTLATQKDRLKFDAIDYYINNVAYAKTATDNISPGTDVVPVGKYGAVAIDIDAAGTVTAVSAPANATTGYNSAVLAVAALPECVATRCRIGWVTASKSDGAFTFDTTDFDAANTTVAYADETFGFTFGTTSLDSLDSIVAFTDATLWEDDTTVFLADTDAPTAVTHLGFLDGYILANEYDTSSFWWCDADTPNLWGALSFASAEGQPDKIIALHISNREITLFGTDSTETYYNDGESPFARYEGGYVEVGCIAPYTIIGMAGSFIFLSHERRVILLENRNPIPMSSPFDDVIRDIDRVSDAYAIYFALGIQSFYVISFPSVERSFVLNLTTKTWSEWGDWDPPEFKLYKARCYCYARDWEMHIVGDDTNAYLYKIRGDHFKHGVDNIRTLVRTGHITHGTLEYKISEELTIRAKRGTGSVAGSEPVLIVRWRNENQEWKPEHHVSLGKIGENNIVARLMRNGVYRTRQYEFVHNDNSDLVISDLEEGIVMMGQPGPGGRR